MFVRQLLGSMMLSKLDLEKIANNIRIQCLKMTSNGGSSHIGSCLSCVDILTFLYGNFLNTNPSNYSMLSRDVFIMSKGHAGAAVYATLAQFGFIDVDDLELHYSNGSFMSGHVSHIGIKGVEFSTGSLGHGLGVAAGVALSQTLSGNLSSKAVCLMSDGELDEGSNWETFMFASHFKLKNLIAFIDRNRLQSLDDTEKTIGLEPLNLKFEAFGWKVVEVDGHNFDELGNVFSCENYSDKPLAVICNTTKGKGVSFMENSVLWHYRSANEEELELAVKELATKEHVSE